MHAATVGSVTTLEPRVRLSRNPVVYCHGAHGSSSDLNVIASPVQPPRRLVDYGFSVIAGTLAVEDWWGTPEGVTATLSLVDQHRRSLDGSGKVVLYGGSMGTATALQTALAIVHDVACIVLVIPCFDLEHQRRASPALRAYINESWDKGPVETNLDPLPVGANPIDRAGELARIPILMHVASDDDISFGYRSFAARHGQSTVVDLGPRGHTPAALAQVDPDAVARFVLDHTEAA